MSRLMLVFWFALQQTTPVPANLPIFRQVDVLKELLQAAEKGETDKIRGLAQHPGFGGADIEGRTALLVAGETGQKIVFAEIIAIVNERARNAAVSLPREGQPAVVGLLNAVESRAALFNAADKKGMTPLMHAARQGWDDLVRLLLDGGATAASLDADGRSAADYADAAGYNALANRLREVK